MYGYPYEVLVGNDISFVSAPGKNDMQHVVELGNLAYEGKHQQFEFWGKRSNGEVFLKDIRLFNGVYFGKKVVVALAQDITARQETEIVLKSKIKELERRIIELAN